MTARTYASPATFKQALETRLKSEAGGGAGLPRRRQLLVFDRLLARLVSELGDAATLKGGLALELRLERARTTKDVDLRMVGAPESLLARLQKAARLDLGDFLTFEIVPDPRHPKIQNDGVRYEGDRFVAACRLAGKPYGQPFGVDVAFGDPVIDEPELVTADDTLDFIGVAPPKLRLYPLETHVAEKLHAYTLPRDKPNSRVKDLPDLALLATVRAIDATKLRRALEQTFTFRKTHGVPTRLPAPDRAWSGPYAAMAATDRLAWATLEAVTAAASSFLDPVLGGSDDATWDPASWQWKR